MTAERSSAAPAAPTPRPSWDPEQYARFGDHRGRPFTDLLSRVGADRPRVVVDLGCGNGPLTLSLAERWPGARIIGLDSSAQMLGRARRLDVAGRVEWVESDVSGWSPQDVGEPVDVIVSNALLQWVPGHRQLLPRWLHALAPGGWLAMQVPGNFDAPSHALLRQLAAKHPRSAELLARLRDGGAVGDPAEYAGLLAGGAAPVDAWETTYLQLLDPAGEQDDPVLEWVKGTALRPVLDVLTGERERADFLATYAARLGEAYPRGTHGTPFPFRRVFAVAHREGGADE